MAEDPFGASEDEQPSRWKRLAWFLRHRDRRRPSWTDVGERVVLGLVVLFLVLFVLQGRDEANQRKAQACVIFETQQRAAINRLVQTYRYLGSLTEFQILRDPLNVLVLRNLSSTEAEAKSATVPAYCGVARPTLPERPRDLPSPPKG